MKQSHHSFYLLVFRSTGAYLRLGYGKINIVRIVGLGGSDMSPNLLQQTTG